MQKITPFLWLDGKAEEAALFYTSIFKNSKMGNISRYQENSHGMLGKALTVSFQLEGQEFVAINAGPEYQFTPAISFFVDCKTQQEVDELWNKLTEGGAEGQCGWLTDKFGLSWQIIPSILGELMQDKDPAKAVRVTQAMLQMHKIDIAKLRQAHEQG